MKFNTFPNGKRFLDSAQSLIGREAPLNNLLYGIAERHSAAPVSSERKPVFFTISDKNSVRMAGLIPPPNHLLVYAGEPDESLFMFAVDNLLRENLTIPGVMGPNAVAEAFADIWQQKTGERYQIEIRERAYVNTHVIEFSHASGMFRPAESNDLPILELWALLFMQEAIPSEVTEELARSRIQRGFETNSLYVWENGEVVSMASSTRPTKRGISVNLVYTPEESRRKGYARSCVAKLTEKLLNDGFEYITLFTDLSNPTSNQIYQEIGYTPIGDMLDLVFMKPT